MTIRPPQSGTSVLLTDPRLPISNLSEWRGLDVPVDRVLATGTAVVTLGKDNYYCCVFEPLEDMVVTQMAMSSTATVSVGLTLARFGLFHIGRRYNLTDINEMSLFPLARTANDTTLFNVANTLYQKSLDGTAGWPTAVRLVQGQRYAVGYYISGTTAPTVVSMAAFMRTQTNATTVFPIRGGRSSGLTGLADLPGYFNGGSFAYDGLGAAPWYNLTLNPLSTLARPYRTALAGDSYFASAAGFFGFGNAQAASRLLPTFNAGVSGDTAAGLAARLAAITATNPQVVVIDIGKNDIAAGTAATTVEANIQTAITAFLGAGAKVIVDTQPPTTSMNGAAITQLTALNTWIKALSQTGVYPVDTGVTLTTGDGVTQVAGQYVADLIHPSIAGQQSMANALGPVIATVVTALGG